MTEIENPQAPSPPLPPPQFRKTKTGKWAVIAPVSVLEAALDSGGSVDVLKKSGDWGKFTVASLGRPFDVDGVSMCYGYGPDDEAEAGQARPAGQGRSSNQPMASQPPASRSTLPPRASRRAQPEPPPPDSTEPLPEYRGSTEDEWYDSF